MGWSLCRSLSASLNINDGNSERFKRVGNISDFDNVLPPVDIQVQSIGFETIWSDREFDIGMLNDLEIDQEFESSCIALPSVLT